MRISLLRTFQGDSQFEVFLRLRLSNNNWSQFFFTYIPHIRICVAIKIKMGDFRHSQKSNKVLFIKLRLNPTNYTVQYFLAQTDKGVGVIRTFYIGM